MHIIPFPYAAVIGLVALFGFMRLRGPVRLLALGVVLACVLIVVYGVAAPGMPAL